MMCCTIADSPPAPPVFQCWVGTSAVATSSPLGNIELGGQRGWGSKGVCRRTGEEERGGGKGRRRTEEEDKEERGEEAGGKGRRRREEE